MSLERRDKSLIGSCGAGAYMYRIIAHIPVSLFAVNIQTISAFVEYFGL